MTYFNRYQAQQNQREQLDHVYGALLRPDPTPPPHNIHPSRWSAMLKSAKDDLDCLTQRIYNNSQISKIYG